MLILFELAFGYLIETIFGKRFEFENDPNLLLFHVFVIVGAWFLASLIAPEFIATWVFIGALLRIATHTIPQIERNQ